MALDAELAETQRQLEQAQREVADLRRQLAEAQGEAQRTVYSWCDTAEDAIDHVQCGHGMNKQIDGAIVAKYAVKLTARKVIKC
jgi:multidrug efflux pump subunit AcrA (membrane-fusion protein)